MGKPIAAPARSSRPFPRPPSAGRAVLGHTEHEARPASLQGPKIAHGITPKCAPRWLVSKSPFASALHILYKLFFGHYVVVVHRFSENSSFSPHSYFRHPPVNAMMPEFNARPGMVTRWRPSADRMPAEFGLAMATFMVVASMVGTGVLTTSGYTVASVGSNQWMLLLWVVGGVTAVCGALTLAELSAALPRTGGDYVYLYEAYGPLPAFLSGWVSFVIGFAGPGAASAFSSAKYLLKPFSSRVRRWWSRSVRWRHLDPGLRRDPRLRSAPDRPGPGLDHGREADAAVRLRPGGHGGGVAARGQSRRSDAG